MNSLWESFSHGNQSRTFMSESSQLGNDTTMQSLVLLLSNSLLSDMSINGRLGYESEAGSHLGRGATFFVERKEARGRKLVAVKHLIRDEVGPAVGASRSTSTRYRLRDLLLEVKALLHYPLIKHRNIVDLLAYGWDNGGIPYLVVDYADLGSLDRFLCGTPTTPEQKAQIAIDVASALELLHACDIVHGDLKVENVLAFSDPVNSFIVKLSDFGFCCSDALGNHTYRGTSLMNAPEVQKAHETQCSEVDSRIDYRLCDVYAYGILVWEVFNNGARFYSTSPIRIAPGNLEEAHMFLSSLDKDVESLIDYAKDFIDRFGPILLNDPATKEVYDLALDLKNVFEMTLARDPCAREEIREVRMTLDVADQYEPEVAIPISSSHFSIFDITTSSMPWSIKSGLAESFLAGAANTNSKFRGSDAFGIAACFALGFGVPLNMEQSYRFLQISADNGFLPGKVLQEVFIIHGLIAASQERDRKGTFEEILCDAFGEPTLHEGAPTTSQMLRNYYRRKDVSTATCRLDLANRTFLSQMDDDFQTFLLQQGTIGLRNLDVLVQLPNENFERGLMHHLIVSHPMLAEALIRKGWEWTEDISGDESPLIIACAAGATNVVHVILKTYPWMTKKYTKDGVTPLHWLFMFQDCEMLGVARALIDHGCFPSRVGVLFFDDFNMVFSGPPLHWAIMARSHVACRTLIDLGFDVNSDSSVPAFTFEYPATPVDVAVSLFLPDITRVLIEKGANIGSRPSVSGLTALHSLGDTVDPFRLLLYHGKYTREAIRETIDILLEHGADIKEPSEDGDIPLHWIVLRETCLYEVLETFLSYNRSAYTASEISKAVEFAAIALQYDQINATKVQLLLEFWQDNQNFGKSPDDCAEALEKCVRYGTLQAARLLIENLGPVAVSIINEREMLHIAAEGNHAGMIQLLLEQGADINSDINGSGTAAAAAAARSQPEALCALLDRGATTLSLPTTDHQTSLLHEITGYASSPHEAESTMALLCEKYTRLFSKVVDNYDSRGFTALHEAIIWGNLKIVALLTQCLHASAISVRDTTLSPTSLAHLSRKQPPWYITQQGKKGIERHDQRVSAVLSYLVESCGMDPADDSVTEHNVMKNFLKPGPRVWINDDVSEWYRRIR